MSDSILFEMGSANGTVECTQFSEISRDMALEGFHHFLVRIDETDPQINVDDEGEYLRVYILDNDSKHRSISMRSLVSGYEASH